MEHWMRKSQRQKGQAVMVAVLFFLIGSTLTMTSIAAPVLRQTKTISEWNRSRQSFFVSEASVEDVAYRIKNNVTVSTSEALSINETYATTTVVDVSGGKQLTSVGDNGNLIRKNEVILSLGAGVSFHYGVQTDVGGFNLNNNAKVRGNVYSNGQITSSNGAVVYGDVISAGDEGIFTGHATGTVRAHTISSAQVDRDAYYQTISNSTVGGSSYPGSEDQPTVPLPDLSSSITEWEATAVSGGTISSPCPDGTYTINESRSLGPIKINCDLRITKSGGSSVTVTLLGHVWVEGNIRVENNVTLRVDSSLGGNSVALIADDPSDRLEGSTINISNNISLLGTGTGSSAIVLVSLNEAGEDWTAINYNNNGAQNDAVFYAPQGLVNLNNNASISALIAYFANVNNNTEIIYKSGLASMLFSSGPSGGFEIGGWKEIQ